MKTFEEWVEFRGPVDDHSMLNRLSAYELYRLEIIEGTYCEFITKPKYEDIHIKLTIWNYENFKKLV